MIRKGAWTAAIIVPVLIAANFLPRVCVYLFVGASLLIFTAFMLLRKRLKNGGELLLLSGAFMIAAVIFFAKYELTYMPLRTLEGQQISAQVQFTEVDDESFTAEVINAYSGGDSVRIPGKLRLSLFSVDAKEWDTATVELRLSVADALTDYADRADGFYARAEVISISDVSTPEKLPFAAYLAQIREHVGTVLRQYVGGEEGGLACAILTGDRQYISDDTSVAFSRCGLSHIMAVSGLHLSVLCALVFTIGKSGASRRITGVCAFVVICAVCVLAGFSMSVLRAGLMSIITFSGMIFRRRGDPLNSLGIALSLLGLCSPFAVLDIAYLLSGAATLGIIAISPLMEKKLCRRLLPDSAGEKIVDSACTTAGATVCTLPISVMYFGEISLVGIPAMLLATWPVTASLVLAALLSLLYRVPLLGEFIGFLLKLCCELLLRIASFLSGVSFAVIDIRWKPLLIWIVISAVALTIWYIFRKRMKNAKVLYAFIAAVLIACVTIGAVSDRENGKLYVAKDGFSVLSYGGDTAIVDCASVYAADKAADWLHANGIYSIRALVITSTDVRACGGAAALMRRIGVETLCLPASAKGEEAYRDIVDSANATDSRIVSVSDYITLDCGSLSLSLLPLPEETQSIALTAKAGSTKTLFVSKGGNEVSRQLCLYYRDEIDADILVVGAATKQNDIYRILVSDVSPQLTAVVSFSRLDGQISEAERMRILGSCSELYQTGIDGDILLGINSSGKILYQDR